MAQEVTLGGERLGSGNKQKVELHNYQMTSFNLDQDFKSTMAPGVLYPFMRALATNHGTFDIDLDTFVRTLPTKGPLFGSFKMQLDIFAVPIRLYQGILHNNPIKVGLNMDKIYLPKIRLKYDDAQVPKKVKGADNDNWQVAENALIKYNGISGIGRAAHRSLGTQTIMRKFQCVPELAYYDIFKNYYANKQEEKAYVITPGTIKEEETIINYVDYGIYGQAKDDEEVSIADFPLNPKANLAIDIYGENLKDLNINIFVGTDEDNNDEDLNSIIGDGYGRLIEENDTHIKLSLNINSYWGTEREDVVIRIYVSQNTQTEYSADIALTPFSLENIDDMRNALLSANTIGKEFVIGTGHLTLDDWDETSGTDGTGLPYSALIQRNDDGISWNAFQMNGLVVKTYQSDLFNNWLDSEYIDGENGISAISAVAVNNNSFTMDSLNLAEKIYEYLNRVLVAGGTYEDWQEATYGEGAVRKAETPMYVGGMSSEIMFEEVIATNNNGSGDQALGDLGGRGTQTNKKGGNNIHIKCDEPSYIIGIASLTPRICYSQGNDWDRTELDTMNDLHKPALDGIGFQNLMAEQLAWWDTEIDEEYQLPTRHVIGKQIAWINYQTAIDKCYGDFAKEEGYGFMVLSRHYEHANDNGHEIIKDPTTYIDPVKYNYAFAYNKLDAQNFWVQIHTYMTARRKMAGKQIPNI